MIGGKSASQPVLRSRFDVAVAALLVTEGGLVANPADPGGITKYGVSLRFLLAEGDLHPNPALFDINHDGRIDGQDIRALNPAQAAAIYRKCFWDAANIGSLPPPLDAMMLDQCVNMGPGTAIRLLRAAAGLNSRGPIDAAMDAAIGRFVGAHGMGALVQAYKAAARTHYHAIIVANPKLALFEAGWDNRVDRLGHV